MLYLEGLPRLGFFCRMVHSNHSFRWALVWLVAIAMPVSGVPQATACGCGDAAVQATTVPESGCCNSRPASCPCSGAATCKCGSTTTKSCCESKSSRTQGANCCSEGVAGDTATSCCSETEPPSDGCQCGDDCRCQAAPVSPQPASPSAPTGSSDREVIAALAAASLLASLEVDFFQPAILPLPAESHSMPPLERCARLCRFRL